MLGFAVATAGFDVPNASLLIAEPRGLAGWQVAFYRSGGNLPSFEELDHVADLFEEEINPGAMVWEAGAGTSAAERVVFSLVYSDDGVVHDDAVRFSEAGVRRAGVREGDAGLESVRILGEEVSVTPLKIQPDAEPGALESTVKSHRGTSLVSSELGAPVLPALVAALFTADEIVKIRLVDPSPTSIENETKRLVATLGRTVGRCTATQPWAEAVRGVTIPAALRAFWKVYDWNDPSDPADLYRELALGKVVGTLHFARPWQIAELAADPQSAGVAFPFATLAPSALGGSAVGGAQRGVLGLAADGDTLLLATKQPGVAGPTLGELLRYLALGFKSSRDDLENDTLEALMLRAHVRSSA